MREFRLGLIVVTILGLWLIAEIVLLLRSKKKHEDYSQFNEDNKAYWKDYFYSNMARPGHLYGGTWPDGMYSRMYYWYPGFETSGWSTETRPGLEAIRWPRSRWERHTQNGGEEYYYLNNEGVPR